MQVQILALMLIAAVMLGAVAGMFVEQAISALRKRAWRQRNGGSLVDYRFPNPTPAPRDAADQLRIVMAAQFTSQRLLNPSEARVFRELDRAVLALNPEWQVMAQVSLGEILRSKDAAAYGCVNSKRVDLLLVDKDCQPRHAIEYQGHGHHRGTAAARDAVKKEALRRAGIGYTEVLAGQTTPSELRQLVTRLVDRPESTNPLRPDPVPAN